MPQGERIYCEFRSRIGRNKVGDRTYVTDVDGRGLGAGVVEIPGVGRLDNTEPDVDATQYVRPLSDEETEAIKEEARMEQELGETEPMYHVEVRNRVYDSPIDRNHEGDRVWLKKSDAEPLIEGGFVSDPIKIKGDKDEHEKREKLREESRRSKIEDLPWSGDGNIRQVVSAVEEITDEECDGSDRSSMEDFLADNFVEFQQVISNDED